MSRVERFQLIIGAIGLIVDIMVMAVFGTSFARPVGARQVLPLSSVALILLAVAFVYGWFTLSWFLVRSHYRRQDGSHHQKKELGEIAAAAVVGVGVGSLPLWLPPLYLLASAHKSSQNAFAGYFYGGIMALFLVGYIIFGTLYFLMPVFYPDMEP
ncbi:MAG: hypothetical protein M5U01_28950 [Ardenticatenaceae bacterium]|nr:hypothetical protein [Ardenticatenaceae bacterium]HBY97249.1 hypothetical protein [Chloroflexota bacterium]